MLCATGGEESRILGCMKIHSRRAPLQKTRHNALLRPLYSICSLLLFLGGASLLAVADVHVVAPVVACCCCLLMPAAATAAVAATARCCCSLLRLLAAVDCCCGWPCCCGWACVACWMCLVPVAVVVASRPAFCLRLCLPAGDVGGEG